MDVQLAPGWPGNEFRRSVFAPRKRGQPAARLRTLVFPKGEIVEVTDAEDLAAIEPDLGHALVEVHKDGKGRARPPGFVTPATPPAAADTAPAGDAGEPAPTPDSGGRPKGKR